MTRNVASIEEEKVDEFSICLGKILKWVKMVLDTRSEDVRRRKNFVSILKHERDVALKTDEDRSTKR